MIKVLHFGGFDVNNYGDLLYPVILSQFLSAEIVTVSPTGIKTIWKDAFASISIQEAVNIISTIDLIIVGGGHLLSASSQDISGIGKTVDIKKNYFPSLWGIPSMLSHIHNIPLIWIGVGAPRNFSSEWSKQFKKCAEIVDLMVVRDRYTKDIIMKSGVINKKIVVLPDPALLISECKTMNNVESYQYTDIRLNRKNKYAVFHIKARYIDISLLDVCNSINTIANYFGVQAVLIPFGQCHGDLDLLKRIKILSPDLIIIDDSFSLQEIVSLIRNATFYCGSSMHGLITAVSFGVSAVVIANEKKAKFKKFSGFFDTINQPANIITSWELVESICMTLKNCKIKNTAIYKYQLYTLLTTFDDIQHKTDMRSTQASLAECSTISHLASLYSIHE